MKCIWQIEQSDIDYVKEVLDAQKCKARVKERLQNNSKAKKPEIKILNFWHTLVTVRMTSQQKSGGSSAVERFSKQNPYPVSWSLLLTQPNKEACQAMIGNTIQSFGGIRHYNKISKHLSENFEKLSMTTRQSEILALVNGLRDLSPAAEERRVANELQKLLSGFGPKQSRNLLQSLGLTRYEIPIDSRLIKWFNERHFPIKLSSTGLADLAYYEFILDGLQELCASVKVLPCVLDAAIFESFED
jgi:hypothetical protein